MKFPVMDLVIEVLDMKFAVMKLTRCFPRERYWHVPRLRRGNEGGTEKVNWVWCNLKCT
ncbi:MAG: hypothetical protein EBE86_019375 [Hormoscilla sp. GUM202]|nr:hypothetical protein [Hormoscilla sp. GUM202]